MAQYPNEIASFRDIENIPGQTYDENKKTTLYTEDIQAMRDEIIEIESILGTVDEPPPAGVIDTVWANQDRILQLLSAFTGNAGLKVGMGSIDVEAAGNFSFTDWDFQPAFVICMWMPSSTSANGGQSIGFSDLTNNYGTCEYNGTRYSRFNRSILLSINGTSIHTGGRILAPRADGFEYTIDEYNNNQTWAVLGVGLQLPEGA